MSNLNKLIHKNYYIKGIPASVGIFSGRVSIFNKSSKNDKKHILIISDLNPDNINKILKFGGLITEFGGSTSHMAILAREKRIPAIVGVKNLFKYIKIGDNVTIDGFSGKIYINKKVKNSQSICIEANDCTLNNLYPAKIDYNYNKLNRITISKFLIQPDNFVLVRYLENCIVIYASKQKMIKNKTFNGIEKTYSKEVVLSSSERFEYYTWLIYMVSKNYKVKILLNQLIKNVSNPSLLKKFISNAENQKRLYLTRTDSALKSNSYEGVIKAYKNIQVCYFIIELIRSMLVKGYGYIHIREKFTAINKNNRISFIQFLSLIDSNLINKIDIKNPNASIKLKEIIAIYNLMKESANSYNNTTQSFDKHLIDSWNTIASRLLEEGIDMEKNPIKYYGMVKW